MDTQPHPPLPDFSQGLDLPYITQGLPGVGGRIKDKPSHFKVEELPLYEPIGRGDHLYLSITKTGLNTRDVQLMLAELFNLDPSQVGRAGLKDKDAETTQIFSVPFNPPQPHPQEVARLVESHLPVRVNWAKYHVNKLRTGHLRGNKFNILITGVEEDALDKARQVVEIIHKTGLPNYYGPQRVGEKGENTRQGWLLLKGRKRLGDRWLRRYLVSCYQAYLCNLYLAERVCRGLFTTLLEGDVAKKTSTGGLFHVDDLEAEQPRYQRGEISFTAPLLGYKMLKPRGRALEFEEEVLSASDVTLEELKRLHAKGTRRMGRILPRITLSQKPGGLQLSFTLPKGSYATTVLREIMKT